MDGDDISIRIPHFSLEKATTELHTKWRENSVEKTRGEENPRRKEIM